MLKAGYCKECKKYVWIKEDGSYRCGHPVPKEREQKIASRRYSSSLAEWSTCPRCNSNRVIKKKGAGHGGIRIYLQSIFVPLILFSVFSFIHVYVGLVVAVIAALALTITVPLSGWYCRDCKAIWRTEKDKEKFLGKLK
jgi:hypothetical protein